MCFKMLCMLTFDFEVIDSGSIFDFIGFAEGWNNANVKVRHGEHDTPYTALLGV